MDVLDNLPDDTFARLGAKAALVQIEADAAAWSGHHEYYGQKIDGLLSDMAALRGLRIEPAVGRPLVTGGEHEL